MKAILLAGGQGSRLRPLTITTPKPIVPIFDRPFLRYQIELLKQVPEIDEIVLSLNYQPRRIEEVFGDGTDLGVSIRYVVEPQPLGTGGAIKFAAGDHPSGPVVVFNGDVLTSVDLPAVIALHRSRQAKATIVLTPVENPSAYGLVQCDEEQSVKAFLEKPTAEQLQETRCDTINAGIYVIEGETLDRIPSDTVYSIERGYFPSLVEQHETFVAYTYRGYWIDIGTREKYQQVHHDIMSGRFAAPPFEGLAGQPVVSPEARIDSNVTIEGPCFIDAGVVIKSGARIGANTVIGAHCHIGEDAVINGAILWPHTWVDRAAQLGPLVAGRHCQFGRNVEVGGHALLGDKSIITDFSRL